MGGAILHIGAHPDDEDVGLLAYMARKFGVRIVYWSATRGEGGQNRIGSYKGEALGIYRTWESLDARLVDGGEALFGPFYDFGYCKTGEDALAKWGRYNLVREIVRAIRLTQPQVVIGRWTGKESDGHGHHQAVGSATLEAFDAAGDPDQFPELVNHELVAWQPSKLYHSTGGDWQPGEEGSFGEIQPNLERKDVVRINTGEFDPIAGRTYQEMAWLAFNKHHTQAMGFIPTQGDFYYYYTLYKSLVSETATSTPFYGGLDPRIVGLADYPGAGLEIVHKSLDEIKEYADSAYRLFRMDDPDEAAASVLDGLSALRRLHEAIAEEDIELLVRQNLDSYLKRKIDDFEKVAAQCLGIQLECLTFQAHVTPGQNLRFTSRIWNNGSVQIDRLTFELQLPYGWEARVENDFNGSLELGQAKFVHEVTVPREAKLTSPYWMAEPREPFHYTWPDGAPSSQPFGPALVEVECDIELGQYQLTLREPAVLREAFSGGFRELPLAIVPPISLIPKVSQQFMKAGQEPQELELKVVARSNEESGIVKGTLSLKVPRGWKVEPSKVHISLDEVGDTQSIRLKVLVPERTPAGEYQLKYVVRSGDRDYGFVLNPVRMGAPGLPQLPNATNCIKEEFVITPASIAVHIIDARFVSGLKYAYIKGVGEELLGTLMSFDLNIILLAEEDIGYTDFSEYDAIIVGPNAYLVRDEMAKNASRFRDYVGKGGTLIVQYQGYGYQNFDFSPYPIEYSQPHDRVTYADAPVKFLSPNHILLNQPNIITQDDFNGWVHDRGLYFFGKWDKRYESILSSHDPGEPPRTGGLLVASYGRGIYLYTGYSFFRQLPAGVRGAFRLFFNVLALPAAVILERVEFLRKAPLFSFMTEEQLQGVARLLTERWVEDGEYLCHQGDKGSELYIIVQGEVDIIDESNGASKIIHTDREGSCIGELAVLESIPRVAAMRAKGDARLLVLEGTHFQSLIYEHPNMSYRVIRLLVRRLANMPTEMLGEDSD